MPGLRRRADGRKLDAAPGHLLRKRGPAGAFRRPPRHARARGRVHLLPQLGSAHKPEADGAVRSEVLGLEVCEVGGRLRFRDYRQGEYLRSRIEAEQSVQEERGNRLRERRLRQEAERAAKEAEAEVTRLRALLASATGKRNPNADSQ